MLKLLPAISGSFDVHLIFITEEQYKSKKLSFSHNSVNKALISLSDNKFFKSHSSQTADVIYQKRLYRFVGIGREKDLSLTQLRSTVRQALIGIRAMNPKSAVIIPHSKQTDSICAYIEGVEIGTYVWNKYQNNAIQKQPRVDFSVSLIAKKNKQTDTVLKACKGVNIARDLVNENADVANSRYLESTVRKITKGQRKIRVNILNEKQLKQKGLGLILAVNKGSANPPKLIIVQYNGGKKGTPYTAFVGKGLTFDTGGLNLKPTGSIETMRMDMGGAAAVIGSLQNIISLKPKHNILFVLGIAENVTGSKSYKPGDIISGYAKISVEVMNTDAEGRLVLADAISYIKKNYKISRLIDAATLTGACVVALGHDYTGLMSNDDSLAEKLLKSAEKTDDRVWRLPLYPELKQSVASKRADVSNLGQPRGAGGAITAAEFLHQFVGDTHWAHLDIAGTGFVDGPSRMYFGHGATGAGVRLMTDFLTS